MRDGSSEYSDVESIEFVVEKKQGVTHRFQEWLDMVRESFVKKGEANLANLIGGLTPDTKRRVPLQAADVAMWHFRKVNAGDRHRAIDVRRYDRIFERPWSITGMAQDQVEQIASRSAARAVPNPFKPKPKMIKDSGGVA